MARLGQKTGIAAGLVAILLAGSQARAQVSEPAPDPATELTPELAPDPAPTLGTDPGQPFIDEFETLDTARWLVSDGWTNGPHQNCLWTADSVSLDRGLLRLTLSDRAAGGQPFSCAEVQSQARYGFGTFEARMRVPFYSGTNANFFTFIGEQQNAPHNEIDFEFIAKDGPTLQTNLFLDGKGGREQLHRQSGDWAFRNYAVVWMPGVVQWFTDGQLVRELRGDAVPVIPQKVFFSLWSTGTLTEWLGPLDYPGRPITLEVDRFAYTPQGAPCAFDGALACVRPMVPGAETQPALPVPQLPPASGDPAAADPTATGETATGETATSPPLP